MPISQSRKALLGQTASVVWPWFLLGKRSSACGNPTASIAHTRYGAYFTVEGSREQHLGACCGGLIAKHLNPDSCCCGSSSDAVTTKNGDNERTSSCCEPGSSCCSGSPFPASTSCRGDNASSSCCDGNDCCNPNAINYIVKSLLEIVFHDERPAYEPYVMPENIRGFLRGKHDQGTARPAAQTQASEGCSCC